MFKTIQENVWAFDCEWVPDPVSGRAVYGLPADMPDEDVLLQMWEKGGATEDNPTPFLKTALCRVVSIAAVTRSVVAGSVNLRLLSLPRQFNDPEQTAEKAIIERFLNAVGQHKPQLVGYNSHSSDIKILMQRGIANTIQAPEFCRRPDKPWEGVDYFAKGSDFNIDLMDILGSWGKASPSLHELATASGIPGKISVDGDSVADLYFEGRLPEIVAYNEFDAITTYLLWLQTAHFAGFINRDQFESERNMTKTLLMEESENANKKHLLQYLDKWEELNQLTSRRSKT